ncbi:PREDICTED: procollagen-lysine,2-oxoglutarate 5-dioxygenase 3 isoform X2 [Papilio polytes]|uniref:procollagen-lysine,2-oxoglutarate 5-dioxygenase 3 isoform X2 n=1 Tax=Papilio polytes TaxID=76194 RepID=UPI0006763E81|nr:PREDICTED: procollagen-lysine,2-oxoglutarate 5-dioxygenase 3 isoform X2 [Papilio polytes]
MKTLLLLSFLFLGYAAALDDVTVLTVATEETDGFKRFMRSAKVYDIDVQVLGQGEKWEGGDMNFEGGGQKVNLLKAKVDELMKTKENDHIVLFTDSYDVMFLGTLGDILVKFKAMPETRVLFSAEPFCWPDSKLAAMYPNTEVTNPYLNSGGFIGYLSEINTILNAKKIKNNEDDQLYYTKVYLSELRDSLKINLDHKSEIFQNLNGALSDVQLHSNTTEEWPYLENVATKQRPLVLHGNGPSKLTLNTMGNYLAKAWSQAKGCVLCEEKRIELDNDNLPRVMVAVFVEVATPFLEELLNSVVELDYPKNKIHLLVRNNIPYHEPLVEEFYDKYANEYATAKRIKPTDYMSEAEARNVAKERCTNSMCEYMLCVDSVARLKPNTLRHLLSSGYDVVAPMVARRGQAWSNFWGAINAQGYYARSTDYMDIVYRSIEGIWNVPFVTNCYLVKMEVLRTPKGLQVTYAKDDLDPDMAFCTSLRNIGVMMYVSNEEEHGHLVNPETYDTSRTHPDMYQLLENKHEWERRYLHEEYVTNYLEGQKPKMPCPDVYWFPLMSPRFCKEWIDIMEGYGQWSDGSNNDKRLEGGYEAVPTRDIHMNQVGLERQWLHILKEYVRPLQEMVFTGYFHNVSDKQIHNDGVTEL